MEWSKSQIGIRVKRERIRIKTFDRSSIGWRRIDLSQKPKAIRRTNRGTAMSKLIEVIIAPLNPTLPGSSITTV